MGSKKSDDAMTSNVDEADCTVTTVELKIKTLDSQTYTVRVNKRMSIPELKEQIETVTGVVSAEQRLICRGKVLKDDQLLSAYHVEDGHTLHLVVRQPHLPSSLSPMSSIGSESLPTHPGDPGSSTLHNQGNQVAHGVVLGTFNVGDHGDGGIPDLNRIVSAVLSSIGITNVGGGSEGMDIREPGPAEGLGRTSAAGNMLDPTLPEIHPHPHTGTQFDSLTGLSRLPTAAFLGPLQPAVIPDSLTTLSQYLIRLKNEFAANCRSLSSSACTIGSEGRENGAATFHLASRQGLPTPASLAEVMASTRQLLIEQAGACLSLIARQLEDQVNVTNPSVRSSIQSSVMGSGVLLQSLGASLLELGRATMTLRMGQMPSEAVVNAGPAVFISSSGPNPIMVQPIPFQPGMGFGEIPMGSLNPWSGLVGGTLGSGLPPRNIDIRIRTGTSSMSMPNVNHHEQDGAQENPGGVIDRSRRNSNSGANSHHQAASVEVPGGAPSITRDSAGAQMLPIRTVVATIPSSIMSHPTSDSSGSSNSVGLFHPLLARVQYVTSRQLNSNTGTATATTAATTTSTSTTTTTTATRGGSQASVGPHNPITRAPELDQQQIPESAVQQKNIVSDVDVGKGVQVRDDNSDNKTTLSANPTSASGLAEMMGPSNRVYQHHQQDSDAQQGRETIGIDRAETAPRLGFDEEIFFSRLVHQLMPHISQIISTEQSGDSSVRTDVSEHIIEQDSSMLIEENTNAIGTTHRRSDPSPPSPDPKRQKRE